MDPITGRPVLIYLAEEILWYREEMRGESWGGRWSQHWKSVLSWNGAEVVSPFASFGQGGRKGISCWLISEFWDQSHPRFKFSAKRNLQNLILEGRWKLRIQLGLPAKMGGKRNLSHGINRPSKMRFLGFCWFILKQDQDFDSIHSILLRYLSPSHILPILTWH